VICNPPYGERLGEVRALRPTYAELGDALRRGFSGWRAALITNNEDLGRATGLRADRKYVLWNGALECTLLCFDAIGAAPKPRAEAKPLSDGAIGLRNRLLKNQKHLAPKLRREDTDCWRVYDADLPDYAAAIDRYGDWLHVQEYAPPKEIEPEVARRRFGEIVRVASEALGVPRERMALKQRRPRTRESQYERHDERGEFFAVRERGLELEVNLFDYLDTGLFLDHRLVRARLRELALGKRFLNLFCYTGSATVNAAAGGAATTTSVDLSATYLEWAGRNLARNGFAGSQHRLVQADSLAWLRAERGEYDLVFVDPPTFSNSKRADDFDVQRDHAGLLDACADRLAPGGLIVFSNNFRRFRLDPALQERYLVVDTTPRTIPPDFARDTRVHSCFEIRRK
jgi:23S rRNA (guanine2445-N2)-methyltransferase / 23S rRNA (guanine2069-N7)-methyltransferase